MNEMKVRIHSTTRSTLSGRVLNVIEVAHGYGGRRSYLCEMPGYSHPGWFREDEVTALDGTPGASQTLEDPHIEKGLLVQPVRFIPSTDAGPGGPPAVNGEDPQTTGEKAAS